MLENIKSNLKKDLPGIRAWTRMAVRNSKGEIEKKQKRELFSAFQVTSKKMSLAKKDSIFLHCLPAHRGEEVTDEVIDGPNSQVFEAAENRLHVQKAIIKWVLEI